MIDAFEKDGHSQREISKKINRSSCAVNNYIKNKNKTPKKIPGRPDKLSPGNEWAIIRDVRKSRKSFFLSLGRANRIGTDRDHLNSIFSRL